MKRFGKLLEGTKFFPLAKRAYKRYEAKKRYLHSFRLSGRLFNQSGYYKVDPSDSRIEPFYIWLPDAKSYYRQKCITGTVEEPVISKIYDLIGEDTTFWDIGANFGYFSFSCANIVEEVRSFEADKDRVEIIQKGIEKNGLTNIDVTQGYVGDEILLDDFDPPDVILLDTEGWEYEILKTSPKILRSDPTWIVELHSTSKVTDDGSPLPPTLNPEGVIEMFNQHDYKVDTLVEHNEERRHIIAHKKGD